VFLGVVGAGLLLAPPPGGAQADEAPAFLAFVRADAPGAQPTHHVRPGAAIELVLLGRVDRAEEFRVCIRGDGEDRCWDRAVKRPRRGIRIATTAPDEAARLRVVWRVGEERVEWRLRVSGGRRGDG